MTAFDLLALIGLVPLLWLALVKRGAGPSWWWMAGAFGVSVLADAFGRVSSEWARYASQTYPVLQSGLFLGILLPRKYAEWTIAAILVAASVSIVGRNAEGLDVLMRVVAFGSVGGVAWMLPKGAFRTALLVYFGGGAVAWCGYVLAPGWTSYALLQAARVVGIGTWCYAVKREAA